MSAQQVATISAEEIVKLRAFHAKHFVQPKVPDINAAATAAIIQPALPSDDLGYYPDGVKRTLSDAEIEILRHSEVQRLLAAKRRKVAEEEDRESRVVKKRKTVKISAEKPQIRYIPQRFAKDEAYHSQNADVALTYDEDDISKPTTKTFQWPILG